MDKSALHRFFRNECSPAERKQVVSWLLNPQNDLLIKNWMRENWDLIPITDSARKADEPDVQKIWNDLSKKLFPRDSMSAGVNHPAQDTAAPHLAESAAALHLAEEATAPHHAQGANILYPEDQSNVNDREPGSHIPGTTQATVKTISGNITRTRWIAAAACIIFALGLFAYAYRESILYIRYQTDFAEVSEFRLPDGSHVVLNANSSLLVPRWGFNKGDRKVLLQGEAAFNVTHTVNHQKFLVTTNGQLNVEVLGTEFLLYSRNQMNKVVLKKGSVKVQFNDEQRQPVLMVPGDVVTADKTGSLSVKHQQPISTSIPWKDHRFVFESATLNEVIGQISEFFGDTISIDDENIGSRTITGSFSASSAQELLTILAEMYNLEIEQTKKKIILKEKASVMIDK